MWLLSGKCLEKLLKSVVKSACSTAQIVNAPAFSLGHWIGERERERQKVKCLHRLEALFGRAPPMGSDLPVFLFHFTNIRKNGKLSSINPATIILLIEIPVPKNIFYNPQGLKSLPKGLRPKYGSKHDYCNQLWNCIDL